MNVSMKHKILGLFVIASLVILVLPLFQHRNNMIVDASLTNAPPFPDESRHVISEENQVITSQANPTQHKLKINS